MTAVPIASGTTAGRCSGRWDTIPTAILRLPKSPVSRRPFRSRNRPSSWATAGGLVQNVVYAPSCVPAVARGLNGASRSPAGAFVPGDWEYGPGIIQDGPYIRNPCLPNSNPALSCGSFYTYGYYYLDTTATGLNFTPNSQIASAVQFGALPTGVKSRPAVDHPSFLPQPGFPHDRRSFRTDSHGSSRVCHRAISFSSISSGCPSPSLTPSVSPSRPQAR